MLGEPTFRRWRIGVCGSSKGLPDAAVDLCRALGRRLARVPDLVIVSGGTKQREGVSDEDLAADWHIISAAEAELAPDAVLDRIATMVRADVTKTTSFGVGTRRYARGKTGEARRIQFIRSVDALIAVGGGGGTAQELALGFEQGIPTLPVPMFPGSAREFWQAYRAKLIDELRLSEAVGKRWESIRDLQDDVVEKLAGEMVDVLLECLPLRCFVITPFQPEFDALFDDVIEPAIGRAGGRALRVDRAAVPGDVVRRIDDGIRTCDCAIAVLDGLRPNVIYEVGLAHGRGKPTILMRRRGETGNDDDLPFDLATQHVLPYTSGDAGVARELERLITSTFARRRAAHEML